MSFNGAQKTYSIKVTFKDETRRLQLSAQNFDFSSLKKAITDLMPSIQSQTFLIQWQDDEVIYSEVVLHFSYPDVFLQDDWIALSSNAELDEAIRVMEIVNSTKLLRFKISLPEGLNGEVKKMEKLGDQPIHTSITCDDCGMSPIVR